VEAVVIGRLLNHYANNCAIYAPGELEPTVSGAADLNLPHLVSVRVGNYEHSFAQGVLLDQLWVRLAAPESGPVDARWAGIIIDDSHADGTLDRQQLVLLS
jgi:hypothetical protein